MIAAEADYSPFPTSREEGCQLPISRIEPGASFGLERGRTAICIPVFGARALFSECIASVFRTVPQEVPIVVADDANGDPAILENLVRLEEAGNLAHQVFWMRQPQNVGFVENMNSAFAACNPADVIILNSDCVVPPGWFESVISAAASDPRIATVSVLTNHGTILSVPNRNVPSGLPQEWTLDSAAEAVSRSALGLHPDLPTGVGHCLLVKRSALDLVGEFDTAFSPGYGEEVDFSQRCVLHGLRHVLDDSVFIQHHGSGSFNPGKTVDLRKEANDEIVRSRYGYYADWVDDEAHSRSSPLARSISAASRALRGLTVTIDGRCLTPVMTGTQLHTLELIVALEKTPGLSVRVVVPPDLGAYAQAVFAEFPNLLTVSVSDVELGVGRTDVVHRPYQVSSEEDLKFLAKAGDRIVVTNQDLIAFSNPGYFHDFETFSGFRSLTRRALSVADRVLFFSNHAAQEAVLAGLVEPERSEVIVLGTDHALGDIKPEPEEPRGWDKVGERPFILCLGTDFRHKNRSFAMRVMQALVENHDWPGVLVLAGPRVAHGSSAGEEAEVLMHNPELARSVVSIAAVSEAEKGWLMDRATAILYPSIYEGFGLGPYEAAEAEIPCLFASQTALGEFLPSRLASVVQWDADESAALIYPLLVDDEKRSEHVAGLQAASARLTWKRAGEALREAYGRAADSPGRANLEVVLRDMEARKKLKEARSEVDFLESRVEELSEALAGYHAAIDHDAMALVGTDGSIPPTMVRPLLAVTQRRMLRGAFFGLLRAIYWPLYLAKNRQMPQHRNRGNGSDSERFDL